MRVPADDHCHTGDLRLDRKIVNRVDEIKEVSAQHDAFRLVEVRARPESIDVSTDGSDGRDQSKCFYNPHVAYVASVEDMVDAAQRVDCLGAK